MFFNPGSQLSLNQCVIKVTVNSEHPYLTKEAFSLFIDIQQTALIGEVWPGIIR